MRFKIGFDPKDKKKLHKYWNEILDKQLWSDGRFWPLFNEKWKNYVGVRSIALSNWSDAMRLVMKYFLLCDKTVLVPSNTFMATPLSVMAAGGRVEFVDCNKDDLCMSYYDLVKKIDMFKPAAVVVVHIGGHIAFEIEAIVELCDQKGIVLIEDCAQAHGADWYGKKAGTWGDCGIYSFYATKTISTGEGAMLVANEYGLVDFAQKYSDYGKPDYAIHGQNARMSEFNAAIGVVETDRLDDIVKWKNAYARKYLDKKFSRRILLPSGMTSGLYKYIVFEQLKESTGRVYSDPCHHYLKRDYELPNTDWVAKNHLCVPLFYQGAKL